MTYPEWFLSAVKAAATKHPDDINKATDRAEKAIRQHEEFNSLIDDMVRDCIRGKVHEFRHQQNIATWKEHGKYGGPAKVNVGASLAVQEVITSRRRRRPPRSTRTGRRAIATCTGCCWPPSGCSAICGASGITRRWSHDQPPFPRQRTRDATGVVLMYYCVLHIATFRVVYCGPHEMAAARALLPGSTFGKGNSEPEAHQQAVARCKFHSEQPTWKP